MKRVLLPAIAVVAGVAGMIIPGAAPVAAAPAAKAPASFAQCAICHSVTANAPARIGPNLARINGRKAGKLPGFAYSPALKNSGITWNDQTLDKWLTQPAKYVPGNRMAFVGISDAKKRKELIAYMKSL